MGSGWAVCGIFGQTWKIEMIVEMDLRLWKVMD